MATNPSRGERAKDERGASAVEYGLLLAGIAAVVIMAVYAFGVVTGGMFTDSCERIRTETGYTSGPGCT